MAVPTVRRNPPLDGPLVDALVRIWTDVSNAGGAVGFVPPVEPEDVRPTAEAAFARVTSGTDDIAIAYESDEPVAFGFLATNETALARHWAAVKRLQRHPGRGGHGIGAAVLAELEAAATDRGLLRVTLTVRGGTGRERFYLAHGYRVDGVLPGRLWLAPGVTVEELHMSKVLSGPPDQPVLRVRRLDRELPLPGYAHPGDAGLDLYARHDVALGPGERAVVPTGVAVALPPGHVGLVHPRSGLAARHGLSLVNAPGTVDEGYRGEIKVIVVNLDPAQPVTLRRGDRVAQLVVQLVATVAVEEVADLDATSRDDGGFGSTGR
jgi:dUTP pyrophosphatase